MLAIAALVVWGHNGYQVLVGLRQADSAGLPRVDKWLSPAVPGDSVKTAGLFSYQAEFRDPFQNWLVQPVAKKVKPKNKPQKPVKVVQRPNIQLVGILKDAAGPLAVIEDTKRQTHFVHEKDEIDGVKILKIDSSWVECFFEREKYRVKIKK